MIAIDAASSEWWNEEEDCYIQPKSGKKMTRQQLVKMWKGFGCEVSDHFSGRRYG